MIQCVLVRATFSFFARSHSRNRSCATDSVVQAAHTAPTCLGLGVPPGRMGESGSNIETSPCSARSQDLCASRRRDRQKESHMKISGGWRGGKPSKKKVRPSYKPKIRWELLGLSDPSLEETSTPIESIRREVSSLASRGFGQGTRSRSTDQDRKSPGRAHQTGSTRARRRGATE